MDVNQRLREVARCGDEVKLSALMRDPGCNALSADREGVTALMWAARGGHDACVRILLSASDALIKNANGVTALMWAARYGHEKCVGVLLPVSDAGAKDAKGRTASDWVQAEEHEGLAQLIDGYALSQTEHAAIGGTVCPGSSRGRVAPRV